MQAAKGDYFPRDAWRIVDRHEVPKNIRWTVRAWDKAASIPTANNPDPDWTAGALVSGTGAGELVVWDLARFRGLPHQVKDRLKRVAEDDGKHVPIVVFEDPGQAGKVDVDEMVRWLAGWTVFSERPVRGKPSERPDTGGRPDPKVTALGPLSSDVRHGKVLLVRGAWNEGLIDEGEAFPGGRHDDQLDAVGLGRLVGPKAAPGSVEVVKPWAPDGYRRW